MMKQEDIYQKYHIDQVFFVGVSVVRKTVVWQATEKLTNKIMAIRCYDDIPRPNYDQWIETTMLNPKRQLIAYYPRKFNNAIGNTKFNNYQQMDLMLRICRKLQAAHQKGKVHANLHPSNILFTHDFKVVDFMDSLPYGNKGTFYSSPQNEQGIFGTWIDVYALGVMFYQLLAGDKLDQGSRFNELVPPFKNPLFPEDRHLDLVEHWDCKRLLKHILNRNYHERLTLPQVIKYLEQIRKGQVILSFPAPKEQILIKLSVLQDEKAIEDENVQKLPLYTIPQSQKSPFNFRNLHNNFKSQAILKFMKKGIIFEYTYAKRELKVIVGFAAAISMTVIFKPSQVPREVRNHMDIELWVLVIYNTPQEMFDFSLNGELWIKISAQFKQLRLQNNPS